MLGGSSSINGLVFVRGQQLDYDTWAQLGNRGWSYDDILPLFRRMEHFESGADEWRAQGGPLRVSEVPDRSPLYEALFRAGVETGLPHNPDYNGESLEGICKTQATIRRGRRMSAAHCYLRPARRHPKLEVATGALATRLILDGTRCTGVRFRRNGREEEALAAREVVLCGGSINSPQLLELSGIGRPAVLGEHGIDVVHELPGVGENLIDHMAEAPAIHLNFLSDPLDRRILVDSVRWVRRIVGASAMDDFRDFEMKPGPEVESDDEIVEWIRATAQTAFHPVGTCRMGQDPMAVVDERLRVRGMESLRIADGSIMPTLVSGNTNAACIMIGEKASEMMLADAAA